MTAPYAYSNRTDGLLNARLIFNDGFICDHVVVPEKIAMRSNMRQASPPVRIRSNIDGSASLVFDHITEDGRVVYIEES